MVYFAMWDSFHSDSLTYHHHWASQQQGSEGEKLWKRKQALNWRHNKQNCALPLVKEERRIEELRQQTGYICSRWVFGSTCALSLLPLNRMFSDLWLSIRAPINAPRRRKATKHFFLSPFEFLPQSSAFFSLIHFFFTNLFHQSHSLVEVGRRSSGQRSLLLILT